MVGWSGVQRGLWNKEVVDQLDYDVCACVVSALCSLGLYNARMIARILL